jgi:hypothetical protein
VKYFSGYETESASISHAKYEKTATPNAHPLGKGSHCLLLKPISASPYSCNNRQTSLTAVQQGSKVEVWYFGCTIHARESSICWDPAPEAHGWIISSVVLPLIGMPVAQTTASCAPRMISLFMR